MVHQAFDLFFVLALIAPPITVIISAALLVVPVRRHGVAQTAAAHA
jgi:hypothetical protein